MATLFGGGGGWEVGALAAGAVPLWSVEWDAAIAGVQERNLATRAPGHRTIVADLRTVDPHTLARPDILLASPVCKAHSRGTSRLETCDREDAWTGVAVLDYVRVLEPQYVAIENAPDYRSHPSFRQIEAGLRKLGYEGHTEVVDACEYGTPSSRKRLISLWAKGCVVRLPAGRPCASWLEALRDLLPTFELSHLAPWQKARIERMRERGVVGPYPWLVSSSNVSTPRFEAGGTVKVARYANEPGWTIVATLSAQGQLRVLHQNGKVQVVNERGFARLQGFPDWYWLPVERTLATKVIGNAVPPPLARAVVEAFQRGCTSRTLFADGKGRYGGSMGPARSAPMPQRSVAGLYRSSFQGHTWLDGIVRVMLPEAARVQGVDLSSLGRLPMLRDVAALRHARNALDVGPTGREGLDRELHWIQATCLELLECLRGTLAPEDLRRRAGNALHHLWHAAVVHLPAGWPCVLDFRYEGRRYNERTWMEARMAPTERLAATLPLHSPARAPVGPSAAHAFVDALMAATNDELRSAMSVLEAHTS